MARRFLVVLVLLGFRVLRGDELLFQYEGDEVPSPMNGFVVVSCEPPCYLTNDGGYLVLTWSNGIRNSGVIRRIAYPPDLPPPSLWVEWRFASNHPFTGHVGCDGTMKIDYQTIGDLIDMFADAVISFDGGSTLLNLPNNEFRTFRFESLDGIEYCFFVEGRPFFCGTKVGGDDFHSLQMSGKGGCDLDLLPTVNRWDFMRYGSISYSEQIIACHPPHGFVDARVYAPLTRFTVTYEEPNYVMVDEITVSVEGIEGSRDQGKEGEIPRFAQNDSPRASARGTETAAGAATPVVKATGRRDNGPPDEVEIVLDQPIPFNATTRFTFNDGVAVNVVEFTFAPGDTDGDGDADLADFSYFQSCFGPTSPCPLTGPEAENCGPCLVLDQNADAALDESDYAVFLNNFGS